ncbi:MAG: hypothetical protein E4G98_06620 [Promethearchaeota archaeon]|nr:MAG: hypothetical protein E4G98_06620 [Candidatus Lokiarchaeota archaeon]
MREDSLNSKYVFLPSIQITLLLFDYIPLSGTRIFGRVHQNIQDNAIFVSPWWIRILSGKRGGWSPSKTAVTIIQAIIAMLNTQGEYINPTDVFNKKAALEMMDNKKKFDKKVKNLVKKYAKEKW